MDLNNLKAINECAETSKLMYDSFVEAGFSEAQAYDLVKTIILQTINNVGK